MSTALWLAIAVIALALVVWRLHRATRKLDTILREEREREPELDGEDAPHEVGRRGPDL
ncbi:hypothetical protein [Actinokineospora pegani]|uniref:hypothetical protein n=1 Tax=Actinokineospora pegani TaxID=2654637 RepID=UPI0012E9EAE4|nr:hypothetical protein [Actinokineospora pegani]